MTCICVNSASCLQTLNILILMILYCVRIFLTLAIFYFSTFSNHWNCKRLCRHAPVSGTEGERMGWTDRTCRGFSKVYGELYVPIGSLHPLPRSHRQKGSGGEVKGPSTRGRQWGPQTGATAVTLLISSHYCLYSDEYVWINESLCL